MSGHTKPAFQKKSEENRSNLKKKLKNQIYSDSDRSCDVFCVKVLYSKDVCFKLLLSYT